MKKYSVVVDIAETIVTRCTYEVEAENEEAVKRLYDDRVLFTMDYPVSEYLKFAEVDDLELMSIEEIKQESCDE